LLRPGQNARVKLITCDYAIDGGLPAKLEHISADTISNGDGESFYPIRVRTEHSHLGTEQNPLMTTPGMTAVVDILKGEKTALDYLMQPVLRARELALRERQEESAWLRNQIMADCQNSRHIVLASKDALLVSTLRDRLKAGLVLFHTRSWTDTLGIIGNERPRLLLLDPRLAGISPVQAVTGLSAEQPELRIVLLTSPSATPALNEVALYKAGVHGFFEHDISMALLNKAVRAVCNGELWMPRTLITRIIEDLSGRPASPDDNDTGSVRSAVECLTPRELQVARMVHLGGNNKSIARELSISERTVKAHLSAIFRKLNIQNRLHLALFLNDVP
jgi:DNA-binding NarL/FixJ family response regulator